MYDFLPRNRNEQAINEFNNDVWRELLKNTVVDYLAMQIVADAQMVQVFESSAEHLSKAQVLFVSLPYLKEIHSRLHERLVSKSILLVPMTIFTKGDGHSLTEQASLGYDIISLEWTVDPIEATKQVGPNITLQENINQQDLYKTPEEAQTLTTVMVHTFSKRR